MSTYTASDSAAFRAEMKILNARQTDRQIAKVGDIIDEARLDHEVEQRLHTAIQRYAEAYAHEQRMNRR